MAAGQLEDAGVAIALEQEGERALGGGLAGGIGIVVDDDAAGEAGEQLDLGFGEAGAATGDDVRDAGAGDGDGVHVALDEDDEIGFANRLFGAVEVVEHTAFRIDGGFGRVEIFRQVVAEGAAAKGDDFAGFVRDREDDAAAETVVEAAARDRGPPGRRLRAACRDSLSGLRWRAASASPAEGAKPMPNCAMASASSPRSSR